MSIHPLAVQYLHEARLADARRRLRHPVAPRRYAGSPRPARDVLGLWLVHAGLRLMRRPPAVPGPWTAATPAASLGA